MPADLKPRFNPRSLLIGGGVLLTGVGLVAALALVGLIGQQGEPRTAPAITLQLTGGQTVTLAGAFSSRVVVINFFASWCPPCRDEAPALRTVWNHVRGDSRISMVGIIYKDDADSARRYLKDYDLGFESVEDQDSSIARAFRISGIPKTFVIAPSGRVVYVHFGAVSAEQLLAAIEEAQTEGR